MTHSPASHRPPERTLRLGLIGGNITATKSPILHLTCGLSQGRNVTYDLIIPAERGLGFVEVLKQCEDLGFDGVNVTYPFKEEAAAHVRAATPVVAAMGASNTVKFTKDGPRAYNTDHSGFIAAYRKQFGDTPPGRVLLLGTGGVGRAIAFALADLGAQEIVMFDTDAAKITSLARAVEGHASVKVTCLDTADFSDISGYHGVVNCTPLGMIGRPGSPLPEGAKGAPHWSFDAVYTPMETTFRAQCEAMGAAFLNGYELYFHQGIDAFEIFSGAPVAQSDWVREIITHSPKQAMR